MTALHTAFSLLVSSLVLASIWLWAIALKKLLSGRPLLEYEPRHRPPWNLVDVFMTILFWGLLQYAGGSVLAELGVTGDGVTPSNVGIVSSGVVSLLTCGLAGLLIVFRTGARWGTDLGLTLRHAVRDITYGGVAFAMLAPIVFAIQMILVQWYPSEHPLIVSFRENPTLGLYLACAFAAAVAAPIFEEFVCRVLLQGFLERIVFATSLDAARSAWPEAERPGILPPELDNSAQQTVPSGAVDAGGGEEPSADAKPAEVPGGLQRVVPIVVSSLVFAGLHWNHGPDPIPLFVLAVGLGYLYQRTHRILPCVVLHFLVNAFTLLVLALSLVAE